MLELVDYEYYKNTYEGSSIPESSFKKMVIKASEKVNYYTQDRINEDNIMDKIRNTTCEIAELLFEQESLKEKLINYDETNKEVASETLGPRSISYVNKSSQQANLIKSKEELEKDIYKICYQSLVHTGLMYRGFKR